MNAFRAKYRPLLFSKGEYIPTGTLQDSDIVGAIADAIAKNVAKLKPQVIRYDEKGMVIKNDSLSRLLCFQLSFLTYGYHRFLTGGNRYPCF